MTIKTEKKEVEIVLRLRKIVKLTEKLKGKNLHESFFKSLRNNDLQALGLFFSEFAEADGKQAFGSILDVYDFIEDYMKESKKTISDIYQDLANEINDMGFFNKRMTKKELEEEIANPISVDIEEIVNRVAEQEISTVAKEEFKGYRA